jgi:hypothetical protein
MERDAAMTIVALQESFAERHRPSANDMRATRHAGVDNERP